MPGAATFLAADLLLHLVVRDAVALLLIEVPRDLVGREDVQADALDAQG